ncbi:hemin-degrading factor [Rhizobium sp. PAMB 3182]
MNGNLPTAEDIRKARQDNPKLRERDLAANLGITEADYIAAWIGHGVRRISTDFERVFPGLEALGEVMALTRNEFAVHEKIGVYDRYIDGRNAAMMLGEQIDMRMFPKHWVHGFAVEFYTGETVKRSFQFFDASGEAVHKVHLRPASDVSAWQALADKLALPDQNVPVAAAVYSRTSPVNDNAVPHEKLRERWEGMTDTHQFVGILKDLELSRLKALESIGEDFAWQLAPDAVHAMMLAAVDDGLPIMCFVGSRGCIQIHSGPLHNVATMGPWVNVMDPTFHLHLRADKIAQTWAVRKPVDKGHVTSIEAYDAEGELIIQFFGKRIEGQDERPNWRAIVEALPRLSDTRAA